MNRKILTMLVTVVAVLIVCRFPLIFGTMACFSGLKTACSWNSLFLGWFLVCFNSGINPWIYFIFNEQFFQGAKYCCSSYFRVVLKSQMKWKCWNRVDVKSKRTHHKHTRVATRGVLGKVQGTNNSIKMFYPDSNMHIFQFLLLASLRQGWITYYACPWHHFFYQA